MQSKKNEPREKSAVMYSGEGRDDFIDRRRGAVDAHPASPRMCAKP